MQQQPLVAPSCMSVHQILFANREMIGTYAIESQLSAKSQFSTFFADGAKEK